VSHHRPDTMQVTRHPRTFAGILTYCIGSCGIVYLLSQRTLRIIQLPVVLRSLTAKLRGNRSSSSARPDCTDLLPALWTGAYHFRVSVLILMNLTP